MNSKWSDYDASRGRPRINIVLDAEEIDMARDLAQKLGESVSALIGQLIRDAHRRIGAKKK